MIKKLSIRPQIRMKGVPRLNTGMRLGGQRGIPKLKINKGLAPRYLRIKI